MNLTLACVSYLVLAATFGNSADVSSVLKNFSKGTEKAAMVLVNTKDHLRLMKAKFSKQKKWSSRMINRAVVKYRGDEGYVAHTVQEIREKYPAFQMPRRIYQYFEEVDATLGEMKSLIDQKTQSKQSSPQVVEGDKDEYYDDDVGEKW